MYNVYIYIYRVWFSAFLMETYSYFMILAQINILFMFLASTDIKTTENYDSDISFHALTNDNAHMN